MVMEQALPVMRPASVVRSPSEMVAVTCRCCSRSVGGRVEAVPLLTDAAAVMPAEL